MSELCKTLEYEFLDPPNASVVQQAQCRTGLPLSSILLLSWFNGLHSSRIHQFESQPYHCSASRLCCCAASSPFKTFLFLVNVCALLERTFSLQCRRTLRRRSTHSTEGMCLFPRPLRVSDPLILCKAFNRDNFPKTRAAKKNPC